MHRELFIIILLLSLFSCRSNKEINQEVHFSDTTQIIFVDTVHYEDNSIKIILEPKNEPIFENTDDLIGKINSDNFRVKDVEVKRSDLSVFETIESKSSTSQEITSQIEEKKVRNEGKNKEHLSIKIVFIIIIIAVVLAISISVYDGINRMRFTYISKL